MEPYHQTSDLSLQQMSPVHPKGDFKNGGSGLAWLTLSLYFMVK